MLTLDSSYTRDNAGRILAIDGLNARDDWTYAYDDLDRLVSVTNLGDSALSETFTYAMNDNMLSRSRNPGGALASGGTAPFLYSYPAGTAARPHAPLSVAGRAFTYDANGNTLNDGIRTYAWSYDNRLASVVRGGQTVTMLYVPDGSRSKKTSSLGSTRYLGAEAEFATASNGSNLQFPCEYRYVHHTWRCNRSRLIVTSITKQRVRGEKYRFFGFFALVDRSGDQNSVTLFAVICG